MNPIEGPAGRPAMPPHLPEDPALPGLRWLPDAWEVPATIRQDLRVLEHRPGKLAVLRGGAPGTPGTIWKLYADARGERVAAAHKTLAAGQLLFRVPRVLGSWPRG